MGLSLLKTNSLKSGFISFSILVCIFIYVIVTNQESEAPLQNVMKKNDGGSILEKVSKSSTSDLDHVVREEDGTLEYQTSVKDTHAAVGLNPMSRETPVAVIKDPLIRRDDSRPQGAADPRMVYQRGGLPRCPENPPQLLGKSTADTLSGSVQNVPSLAEIAEVNPSVNIGGRYAPWWCEARYKVAIIIPMRGREDHLPGLFSHMHPVWQRQEIDYTVYVITQAGNHLFNKGKLMNAGFMEAKKDRKYDCYVFHDADLLLEDDHCLYWCTREYTKDSTQVTHLGYLLDKFDFKPLKYRPPCMPPSFRPGLLEYFGGITMFSHDQFISINGFSNIYWGWGAEDNDAAIRVEKTGFRIRRNPECRFRMYKHDGAGQKGTNPLAKRMMQNTLARQRYDGLNTLKYKVLKTELEQLYTNITIDVGAPSEKFLQLMEDPMEWNKCNADIFLGRDIW